MSNHLNVKMPTNEYKAKMLGRSSDALLRRLLEAKNDLANPYRKAFKRYTYVFANKCLISECGKYRLQWKLRNRPNKPEGPTNQQTATGIVLLEEIPQQQNIA